MPHADCPQGATLEGAPELPANDNYQDPGAGQCTSDGAQVLALIGNLHNLEVDGSHAYFLTATSQGSGASESAESRIFSLPLSGAQKTELRHLQRFAFDFDRQGQCLFWMDRRIGNYSPSETYEDWSIVSMNVAGGVANTLATGNAWTMAVGPSGIAVAQVNPPTVVHRSFDGAVRTLCPAPEGILELAVTGETILYASHQSVSSCPLTGGDGVTLVTGHLVPHALQIDTDHVYGVDGAGGNGLWRVPLSGGAEETIVAGSFSQSLAIDDTYVYFEDGTTLYRVPKSGGAPETIVGERGPIGVIRSTATHLYWAEWVYPIGCLKRLPKRVAL